ncbi:MAG: histidine phosphatase family protein [Pacificimonas sp.]|jgi:phosphohistidine phosphatase|nr:histidine phosphatase family protein [Pacificimonas sp.]
MKQLILLRHAKSSWKDGVATDFERPLNAKGARAARLMGEHAARTGIAWDEAVASPARRVQETIAQFADGYGQPVPVRETRDIYMANVSSLIDVLSTCTGDRVLMVGHNPGLEDLIFHLTPADDGPARREVDVKYPTATLCRMTLKTGDWSNLPADCASIDKLVRPRDLDPDLGPDAD